MSNSLISIIVPVFNKERELNHCLDSIINQSYQNLQIILINDGSTDSSGQICEDYLSIDDRIEVHHQENRGISFTRNKGLDLVKGSYCMFVDGDDYVALHYVYNLYQTLINANVSMAGCQYTTTFEKTLTQNVKYENFKNDVLILDAETMLYRMLYHDGAEFSVWDKIYKIELFDNLRFPVNEIYEDLNLVPQLVMKAESVAVHLYTDYFNFLAPNSIQRSVFKEDKLAAVKFMKEISEDLVNEGQTELKKAAAYRYFDIICELLFQMESNQFPKIRRYLWGELLSVRAIVRHDRHPNASRARLGALLSYLGFWPMRSVYRLRFKIKHG